jgi:hypothetical protein
LAQNSLKIALLCPKLDLPKCLLVGLHLKWRNVSTCGHILGGAIRIVG